MARTTALTREKAYEALTNHNKEPFLIKHALTLEGTMRYFADDLGYGDEADYWGIVGLLHDIDYEKYPDQHCLKAPELLAEIGAEEDLIRAVVSHGHGVPQESGVLIDCPPEHEMEKVLFAVDELTGLIGAVAIMRPSKSTKDLELKSVKKKFKDRRFAAGCNRDIIQHGADELGWELDTLIEKTILAMREVEDTVNAV
jgi:predicted hydrolase (HD superfamily)